MAECNGVVEQRRCRSGFGRLLRPFSEFQIFTLFAIALGSSGGLLSVKSIESTQCQILTHALPCLFIRSSNTLQTYAGDTLLPGGMSEEEDKTIEDTSVSSTINS